MKFIFAEHVLDLDRRELWRGGELIALEPQVFDLLVYLVRNRDHVVSKDDLLEAVWGGRIVSESTLTSRITAVRKAVGDSGKAQLLIRTAPRKGIRFVGVVQEPTGDDLLAESPSVVDAVRCAAEVRRAIADREPEVPDERRIRFRIGINLGEVIAEKHDIFGNGVNVAARLEALAEPGGICVSRVVRDQVRDRLDFSFEDMGEQEVKNIARPVQSIASPWPRMLGRRRHCRYPTSRRSRCCRSPI